MRPRNSSTAADGTRLPTWHLQDTHQPGVFLDGVNFRELTIHYLLLSCTWLLMKWAIWHRYVQYEIYYNLPVILKKWVLANLANYFPSVSNCASLFCGSQMRKYFLHQMDPPDLDRWAYLNLKTTDIMPLTFKWIPTQWSCKNMLAISMFTNGRDWQLLDIFYEISNLTNTL